MNELEKQIIKNQKIFQDLLKKYKNKSLEEIPEEDLSKMIKLQNNMYMEE